MTTPLEAALGYAALDGYGVFPCTAKKIPIKIEGLFDHGFASATTDADVITKAWTTYAAADIGLALPRGVLVVDVDVAKGKQGLADFIRLFGCPPKEMATAVSTTARGGWHVYFRFEPVLQLVQTTITSSLDARIGGLGYVVVPCPGNGRRWIQPLLSTPLMEAPHWLLEGLRRPPGPKPGEAKPFEGQRSTRAQEALDKACAALAAAPPGARDTTIGQVVYRVGRLAAAGELESGSGLQALLAAMASNPGMDKSHCDKVERCFNDGFKIPAEPGPIDDRHSTEDDFGDNDHADDHRDGGDAGDRQDDDSSQRAASESSQQHQQPTSSDWDPIDLDLFLGGSDLPPPELSDEALPQSWAEIIRAFAAVAEAPPDYVAIAAIAGAAGAIGNACVVEGKRGWREAAVLWGVLIGPPSAHKTPAMKAAHNALAAIDHALYVEWKKECEQLEAQHQMALDAQAAEGKPKKTVKKPEKPPLKHLLHDDTSLEKLTINMAASPHGAVAFYSELAAWFASFSRYSGGDDSSGRALWNRAYDAERFKRDRVKNEGPPIVVPAAACSVVGAIQPDKLRQIWPKSHDGLLARPIYVWPRLAPLPSEQSNSNGDDVSGGETYAFRKALKALYDLPLAVDGDGVAHPTVLRLASDARLPFTAAKRDCERRARRERGLIGEWLGKSPGRILRLALTFHLMTWSASDGGALPTSIGLDALERAIHYFQYAEGMLRRTLAGLEPSRSAEDALAIAKQIGKKEWRHFTNNDVGREQGFRWFRGEDAENKRRRDNTLSVLVDANVIRQDLVQTGRGAIQKWAVNPDLGEQIRDF
jgi:hypothetical protein